MDVEPGHCWRCEKVLPQHAVHCSLCPLAVYCSTSCRNGDKARHGSVECKMFGRKKCKTCAKTGTMKECSRCNGAWYCNKECQERDWPAHKTSCNEVKATVQGLAAALSRRQTYGDFPWYFGNTMAKEFLQLDNNEWSAEDEVEEGLARDYHVLSTGCGDLRNTVLTAGSLPDRYQGKLHVTLNDFDPFVMARNVLFLFMLVRFADIDHIASSLTTIWYSLHLSEREYDLIKTSLNELLKMNEYHIYSATKGLVSVPDEELKYLRRVWVGWQSLECQRDKKTSINLRQQKKNLFAKTDFSIQADRPMYLHRVHQKDKKFMEEWFDHALFLPKETREKDMPFDNPTLTALSICENIPGNALCFQLMLYRLGNAPEFVYCIKPTSLPFVAWDCQSVRESTPTPCSSPMVMYHNYVTNLLQRVKSLILQGRLLVNISLAECLDFPRYHEALELPNYDRIFTSNLADYLGFARLLQTFKPLLNASNRFSAIVTETMNWYTFVPTANTKSLGEIQIQQLIYAYCLDKKLSLLTQNISNNSIIEYYDNTSHFLQYLRADIMAGGPGIPALTDVPSFCSVKTYHGMQMRDFRKGLNKLVPFWNRVNTRDLNMMNGYDRAVEWCLPNSNN